MQPFVNPYSITNKDELAKKYPDFARRVGMTKKKKIAGPDLETLLKKLLNNRRRRARRTRPIREYTDPMGPRIIPPDMPESFGTGGLPDPMMAPPGAPSRIYQAIANIGQQSPIPMDTLDQQGQLNLPDQYGFRPSDFSGIIADRMAREQQAMYPTPQGPGYEPMSTAPPVPQQEPAYNQATMRESYMGGMPPVRDLELEAALMQMNRSFDRGWF